MTSKQFCNFRESVIPDFDIYLYSSLLHLNRGAYRRGKTQTHTHSIPPSIGLYSPNIDSIFTHLLLNSTVDFVFELLQKSEARGASAPCSPGRPTSWPPQRPGPWHTAAMKQGDEGWFCTICIIITWGCIVYD